MEYFRISKFIYFKYNITVLLSKYSVYIDTEQVKVYKNAFFSMIESDYWLQKNGIIEPCRILRADDF